MRQLSLVIAAAVAASIPTGAFAQSAPVQSAPVASDCMSPTAELTGTVQRVTFRSRGREIQGLLYKPARPNGAGIVAVHDREGIERDVQRYEAQLGRLATCGYTVIVPSYYDAAGPRSVNDPMLTDKWTRVIDEAINHLVQVDGIDAARIGVWGYGRGGALTLEDAYNGIAANALVAVSAHGRAERPRSPLPPILLIAGDHDPDAPIYAAEEFARTSRRLSDIDVTVQSVPADLHEFTPAAWEQVFIQSREFFDKHLLPAN